MGGAQAQQRELTVKLVTAIRQAWALLQERYADHTFYGFALYTSCDLSYIMCTSFTEEGLAEAVDGYGDASMEHELRWNGPDSPWHGEGDEYFVDFDLSDDPTEAETELRFGACIAALQQLDQEGLFGEGDARDRFVLNVLQGDQSYHSMVDNARMVNPPGAVAWFESFFTLSNDDRVVPVGDRRVYQARGLAHRGDLIAVVGDESRIELIQIVDGGYEQVASVKTPLRGFDCVFSPDGSVLWVVGEDTLFRVSVDGTTLGAPETIFVEQDAHKDEAGERVGVHLRSVLLGPAPETVLVVVEGMSRLLTTRGEKLWSVEDYRDMSLGSGGRLLACHPDGVHEVDASSGKASTVHEVEDAQVCVEAPDGASYVLALGHSYANDAECVVEERLVANNELVWSATIRGAWWITSVRFSPTGQHLAVATVQGEVRIYDRAGTVCDAVTTRLESVSDVAWIADDTLVIIGRDVDKGPPARAFTFVS